MATIGLSIIVKNEAHIIRRCLESVLPLLDYVLVVDTGSTDGTQQAVRDFLCEKNLPGEVVEEPWRDFAYNRSFALAKLRERQDIDYSLMIDADEVLRYEPGFDAGRFKRGMAHDIYDVETRYGNINYLRPQLISNRLPFFYKGVLHEYLDIEDIGSRSRAKAKGFYDVPLQDSARSVNPRKFLDDADFLESALQAETDPFLISRYTFYLAQSYRDGGAPERALQAYRKRSQLGYWQEEVFVSLLHAARLMDALNHPDAEIIQAYMAAYESLPTRVESLHDAARFCRLHNQHQQAYILSKHGLAQPRPQQGLFLEPWIYDYGLLDEFSIAAYWAGHYRESFDACVKLLKEGRIPPDYRPRIRANAQFSIDQLKQPKLAKLLPE
jgi:glycosyltransferase involved in cell wall biosynthesis